MAEKVSKDEVFSRCIRMPVDVSAALDAEKIKRPEMSISALVIEAIRARYMSDCAGVGR